MPKSKLGEADIQRLLDLSPAVHYIAEVSGDYGAIYVSDGIQVQLGYMPEQFMQDSNFWASCIHPDDQSRVLAEMDEVFRKDRNVVEYRFQHADGSWRWMYDELRLIRDEAGNPSAIVGSWLDITRRVELEREVITVTEQERRRIGRDLHDGVGKTLTGISLGLKALGTSLVAEQSPHVQTVRELRVAVQGKIAEIRRAASLLTRTIPDDLSLSAALARLAQQVSEYPDVRCHVRYPDDEKLHDPGVETHLYRIAQESVTNALRHGNAQNIELRYESDGELIHLEVLDDGVGISAAEADGDKGSGLRNIRSRARLINGRVVIEPRVNGGTRVLCSCPAASVA
jgi:PAS domain S-box-containing protein